MSYLETVLTYDRPSEAEVDKAFLESHGITVVLLNANTARNELGAPFFVRLQVMGEDRERALGLIREANPERLGSPERVAAIDRDLKRVAARFLLTAIIVGGAVYWLLPEPQWKDQLRFGESQPFDIRPLAAALAALVSGILAVKLRKR